MKPVRVITIAFLCVLVGLVAGLWLGGHPESLPDPIVDAFVSRDAAVRDEVLDVIDERFYRDVDTDEVDRGSIQGIVKALDDRFSHYFNPKDAANFQEHITGKFEGVGMSVEEAARGLLVVQVFEGSPAEEAGIVEGDVVTRVDGESIAGQSADLATTKIRGKSGTSVELTYLDSESERTRNVTVERAEVDLPVVESEIRTVDGTKLGVLRLLSFSQGVHGRLGLEAQNLLDMDVEGLVLDLRGNGGGLLQEAVLVASTFVEDGEIVTTRGRTEPERVFTAEGDAVAPDIPMVVLVDRGSASASEIVTGALRDLDRATIIGQQTFGKGTFQEIQPLSNGGVLDLTVGSYYLPDGESITGEGIPPEVRALDDPETDRDEALPETLEALVEEIKSSQ
jgi:carboxyl-terminal processing protease